MVNTKVLPTSLCQCFCSYLTVKDQPFKENIFAQQISIEKNASNGECLNRIASVTSPV